MLDANNNLTRIVIQIVFLQVDEDKIDEESEHVLSQKSMLVVIQ